MDGPVSIAATLQWLAAQGAIFVSLLLAASALHKILQFGRIRAAAAALLGGSTDLATLGAVSAIIAEAAAAFLLFIPARRTGGAWLAACVWTAYFVLLLRAVASGRQSIDCGCSFDAGLDGHRRPGSRIGAYPLLRNAGLVLLCVGVGAAASGAAASGAFAAADQRLSCWLAAVAGLALYAALDQVMTVEPLRRGAVR